MASLLHKNAVFLHVPKTGGMYIKGKLNELNLIKFEFSHEHADMERVINTFGHYPANSIRLSLRLRKGLDTHIHKCFKFCFVRNPIDWYESYWRFMQDHNWRKFSEGRQKNKLGIKWDPWHPFKIIEAYGGLNFNEFIEKIITQYPGFLTQLFNIYADPLHINFIGKYENMDADLKHILNLLEVGYNEKIFDTKYKVNESMHPKPIWDLDLKNTIYKLELPIFIKYNYEYQY